MSLRFHQRHIHKTVADHIEAGLDTLGWITAPRNFGTTALTFLEVQPEEEGTAVTDNTVAISVGDEDSDNLEELGGGLYSVKLPIFFDVYTGSSSLSVSIACDIKDLITRDKVIYVKDWTNPSSPTFTNELIYFEDVVGPERPPVVSVATDFRKHWRVVKAIAHVYYGPTTDSMPSELAGGFIFVGEGAPTSVPGAVSGSEYLDELTGNIYRLP